jgi:SAM-dependent methyltransferase
MKKADYSKIAVSYDKGRHLPDDIYEIWLRLIARYSGMPEGSRVLDLGCGTGRFAIPMAQRLHYQVTGADSSREMIAKAKEKDISTSITWDCQDAQNLTYSNGVFDMVFMSHLLHHVDSPFKVLQEYHRVLTRLGVVIIRYGAIEQVRGDVEHTFFPEALALDEQRTPSMKAVETWLRDAGFLRVVSEQVVQRTFETLEARIEADRAKGISVLTLISPNAYNEGLHRLVEYVAQNPGDPWLLQDRGTLTVGYVST